MKQIIEVHSVSKSFGGVQANQDISLSVKEGIITGLIGPNGSGTVSYTHLTLPTNREV